MAETLKQDMENPMLSFLNSTNSFNFSGSLLNPTKQAAVQNDQLFDQFSSNDSAVKKAILSNGTTIELKLKTTAASTTSNKTDEMLELSKESESLINIKQMMNRLEIEKKVSKTLQEEEQVFEEPLLNTVFQGKNGNKKHHSLWTEKYRPSSFLDLIGNERTNRYVLSWLNHWNKAVYHREVELKSQKEGVEDPFDRPNHRILMIHGPPGIGKTSIAHVIAKQLKYEVMEINASDERSGTELENKVRNSLTSITFSGKPVCLVIDEIDGTSEYGMTKILLNILREDRLATNEYLTKSNNKGSTRKNKLLLRPIITICNNVYSNSIEKLKPYCEIVKLQRPNNRLLKSRLQKIVKSENLFNITDLYLDSLIISSNGDLRNCLNHLQFNSNQLNDASSKDTQLNWYLILDKIFNRTISKSKTQIFNEMIQSNNFATNLDKLITSCFQTYLGNIELNNDLTGPLEINNWLYFHDLISSTSNSDLFNLSNFYSLIVPLKFFQLFNEIQKYNNGTNNNSKSYEANQRLNDFYESRRANLEIVQKFKSNIINSQNPKLLINNSSVSLPTFEIHYVTRMITPGIKSLSSLKPNEKIKLDTSLSLIQAYNLQFQTIKDFSNGNNNGHQYSTAMTTQLTRLSPNTHALTTLIDQSSSPAAIATPRLNSMLIYIQDQLAHLRSSSQLDKITLQVKRKQDTDASATATEAVKKSKSCNSSVEFFKARYSQLNSKLKSSGTSDSPQQLQQQQQSHEGGKSVMSLNEYRIWVKYHEGFSNAVKKNIKFEDLF